MLCEFTWWNIWPSTQQEKLCTGLAYSTQHVANEDVNQFVWGGGVGVWRCWFSIAIEITKTNGRDPRTNHIYCWSHAIPYPVFGVVINIMSKEDNTYYVTIGDITQYMCLGFTKMSSRALQKKEVGVLQAHILCGQISLQVDFENVKFIHAPMYTYNKVMCLLKLASVVAHE